MSPSRLCCSGQVEILEGRDLQGTVALEPRQKEGGESQKILELSSNNMLAKREK